MIIAVIVKHNLSSCEIKAGKKKFRPDGGIQTHELCDTGAVLYQLGAGYIMSS